MKLFAISSTVHHTSNRSCGKVESSFQNDQKLDVVIPAFDHISARKKLQNMLDNNKLYVLREHIKQDGTKEMQRYYFNGILENCQILEVHGGFRGNNEENGTIRFDIVSYNGKKQVCHMGMTHKAFHRPMRQTNYGRSIADGLHANPEQRFQYHPEVYNMVFANRHGWDKATEDFSSRAKSCEMKLKKALKEYAYPDYAEHFEKGYRLQWTRLSNYARKMPSKKKTAKKTVKVAV